MRSDELARLVPPRQEFGYDLIDFVGRARYLDGKQREEIRTELRACGVQVSTGTISALCDRFLAHLERLHIHKAPALRAALSQGYALHIDATCDKGKGGHFLCMDGITGWVLRAARIDSESGATLAPVVQSTVELLGDPVAIMRDMGKGGVAAIRDEEGRIVAVVERTNNILEHRFGIEKQRLRKRIGRAELGRDLQQQPAQAMLACNLRDSRYVEILCGSLENLPEAFARLDRSEVAAVQLTRDHRDSHLDRLVREMLKQSPGVAGAGRLPPPSGRIVANAPAV